MKQKILDFFKLHRLSTTSRVQSLDNMSSIKLYQAALAIKNKEPVDRILSILKS